MRRWDQRASILGLGLGLLLAISSLRLDFGEWNQPGPGFMPFLSGMLLITLCFIYGVRAIWSRDEEYNKSESPWPKQNLRKLINLLASLFIFTLFLTTLGYVLSTLFLMFFLFRLMEPEKWYISVIKAALIVLITHIVFEKWLMVQFPKGILGV